MKNSFFRLPENMSSQARSAFLIAMLISTVHFVAALYYLYLGQSTSIFQFTLLGLISILLGVVFIFGARLSRRESAAGIILVLATLAFSYPLISAFLVSGLGSVLGIALLFVGAMSAFQTLPRKSAWGMTIVTALSGLVTLLLDVFGSGTRPSLPGIFIQLLATAVVGVIIFLVIRQFRAHSMRLISKLLTPILIFITLILTGLMTYNSVVSIREFDKSELERLERMQEVVSSQIQNIETLALGLVTQTANSPEVQAAFAAHDRERLTSLTLPTFEIVKKDFAVKQYQFILPPATSFLRLHKLEEFGDDLTAIRATLVEANAQKTAISGIEIGRNGLGVRGVVPVSYQGQYLGVVEAGIDIGPSFLETLKQDYGMDVQIVLEKEAMQVATMIAPPDAIGPTDNLVLHASTLGTPFFASASNYNDALAGVASVEHINFKGREYAILSAPLYDFSGKVIGVVDIVSDHTAIAQQQNTQIFSSIGALLGTLLVIGLGFNYFARRTLRPIGDLTTTAAAISNGELDKRAEIQSNDEIGILATAFNSMTSQLQGTLQGLEQRVADRTHNLELAAEVGRTVSQVRALDVMLKDACELILKEFNLYYVQVYLTDASGSKLTLEAGTGSVGAELIGRGHSLPLDIASINGRAAVEKRSVVISDTTQSATFRQNSLLPETRGEMAVPLIVANKVVGVLDMQSREPGVLSEEVLPAFEALAGQLAVAIQNSNLLAETEEARAEVEKQARRLVRTGWNEHLDAIHKPEQLAYLFTKNAVTPLADTEESQFPENGKVVSAPIAVTGEPLGSLTVEIDDESRHEQTSELVHLVARQVAQQIESLRLLESAERYRLEAEEASRRLTREGWKSYVEHMDENLSFVYDLKEVRPQNNDTDQAAQVNGYALPIKVREQAIGKLVVQGLDESNTESLELANAVTERLSAHIESLRQFEETQRSQLELDKRARQLAAVAEVSAVSSRELDIQKMLESVVYLTQRKFGLYHAHIFIYNSQADVLKIAACGWKEGDEHEGTHGTAQIPVTQEQSLVARAARTQQYVIVNDVHNEPGWLPNPLLPDSAAELAVPLIIGDKLLGVLDVQADHLDAFTAEDASIYLTLASQIATALQNAQSFAQAQQQAERESKLNVISQKIQSATTVEAVLQIAARELGHTLGAPLTIAQLGLKETASGN